MTTIRGEGPITQDIGASLCRLSQSVLDAYTVTGLEPAMAKEAALLATVASAPSMIESAAVAVAPIDGSPSIGLRTNQVKLHAEGRFGFAVTRPEAFAVVSLTA